MTVAMSFARAYILALAGIEIDDMTWFARYVDD
jgi:hypothetical protein